MRCRSCKAKVTLSLIDLGACPPSNAYVDPCRRTREVTYPLRILVCESCWLVQVAEVPKNACLFPDDYAYFSSYSTSWLEHARRYVVETIPKLKLKNSSLVAEIASNDGYLLQYFLERDIPCYGIEPTRSTRYAAQRRGIDTIPEFFDLELAKKLAKSGRQADLVIANNVLAHVPDIDNFLRGVEILLKPDGVATIEFPQLLNLVQENQFDTIYHEHYSYLSLVFLNEICQRLGLNIFNVEKLKTHGGSLRLYLQRASTGNILQSKSVERLLKQEEEAGMRTREFYSGMQDKAETAATALLDFLNCARDNGARIGGYGAAAKANTLLNFAGIKADLLPYIVDQNPVKQGLLMPGSHIPIVEEQYLREQEPNYVLLLPWNLRDEIMETLSYIRGWGGRFVIALPQLQIL